MPRERYYLLSEKKARVIHPDKFAGAPEEVRERKPNEFKFVDGSKGHSPRPLSQQHTIPRWFRSQSPRPREFLLLRPLRQPGPPRQGPEGAPPRRQPTPTSAAARRRGTMLVRPIPSRPMVREGILSNSLGGHREAAATVARELNPGCLPLHSGKPRPRRTGDQSQAAARRRPNTRGLGSLLLPPASQTPASSDREPKPQGHQPPPPTEQPKDARRRKPPRPFHHNRRELGQRGTDHASSTAQSTRHHPQ